MIIDKCKKNFIWIWKIIPPLDRSINGLSIDFAFLIFIWNSTCYRNLPWLRLRHAFYWSLFRFQVKICIFIMINEWSESCFLSSWIKLAGYVDVWAWFLTWLLSSFLKSIKWIIKYALTTSKGLVFGMLRYDQLLLKNHMFNFFCLYYPSFESVTQNLSNVTYLMNMVYGLHWSFNLLRAHQ